MKQTEESEQFNTRGGRMHQKEQASKLVSTLGDNGFRRKFPWFGKRFIDSAGSSVRYRAHNHTLVPIPAADGSESPNYILYSGLRIDAHIIPGDKQGETVVANIRSIADESYHDPKTEEYDRPFWFQ